MSESTIPTTFGLAAKNISAFAMALNEKTGEQIDSLAKIAASRKMSCTSSDATWSDVHAVEVRHFTASVLTMTDLLTNHAKRPNQSLQLTAGRHDDQLYFHEALVDLSKARSRQR
ncbi:MAG: hypothetical protein DMF36_07030 [Verrucomicrobia bacterium]|jgi:hypothetical protein|nr:MAG: hypothetical protein AUH08_03095 [Verrucomicrobia bacterium 13_2_20CM_54_12]OLD71301.1 MAG: hypothetical protein AUF68_10430 [Verrucomicrobia bacterium 13_1_20CM_54_28]PYK13685.1 MAG: hypothetical protein DME64_13030 [Verrucomicrobiota bacterium]PYL38801.1 MAG: hypothetical protein DMF36_07030 [Verrucomicrobiota bacterium]